MTNVNKPSYLDELKSRVDVAFNNHVDAERQTIYSFAAEVARESFKNGRQAGFRYRGRWSLSGE